MGHDTLIHHIMAQKQETFVKCINCKWADLMQWMENPIIAQCNIRDERQVAASKRICKEFIERTKEAPITHYDRYAEEEDN